MKSQAIGIQGRFTFSGRFAQEGLKFWPRLRAVYELVPTFIILLSQKEPGEVGNFGTFVFG